MQMGPKSKTQHELEGTICKKSAQPISFHSSSGNPAASYYDVRAVASSIDHARDRDKIKLFIGIKHQDVRAAGMRKCFAVGLAKSRSLALHDHPDQIVIRGDFRTNHLRFV